MQPAPSPSKQGRTSTLLCATHMAQLICSTVLWQQHSCTAACRRLRAKLPCNRCSTDSSTPLTHHMQAPLLHGTGASSRARTFSFAMRSSNSLSLLEVSTGLADPKGLACRATECGCLTTPHRAPSNMAFRP